MFESLLVPTDFSAHARLAVDLALQLLPPDGGRLCLLTIPERDPGGAELRRWTGSPAGSAAGDSVEAEVRAQLHALAEEIARPGLVIEELFSWVQPAIAIVDLAEEREVEAIVMGSRGRSDVAGLVLGSVSHRVLHTTNQRVIVVR